MWKLQASTIIEKGEHMKAVIDRFEGDFAIVLFGNEEIKVDIPKELLPKGSKEGSWLKVYFELDLEETKKREDRIKAKLEKLKKKGQGG